MAKQDEAEKTASSPGEGRPRKPVIVSGSLGRASVAPKFAHHFLPDIPASKAFNVFDAAGQLEKTEWWSAERLAEVQLKQATELVRYARENSPFYKDRLAGIIDGADVSLSSESFAAIPCLTREAVQGADEQLFCTSLPLGHGPTFDVHTTGSSGKPVHVRSTRFSNLTNLATSLRGHRWFARDPAGTNVTIKVVSGNRGRSQTKAWAPGRTGSSYIYSNRIPVRQLLDWLLQDEPNYLQCHPSILQELIYRSLEVGEKPKHLRDVRSMGEILEPGLRILCQREWGVPVRDNYSCEELATLALTCPEHDHLHIQAERALVEILNDQNQPCAPGEVGRVVVTGLMNFATPLIRYELGDRAVAGAQCSCGRGLGVIERVIGRERLPIILPSGDRVFPVLDAEPLLLKGGVRQYQLVQTSPEDIDIRLVADARLTEGEAGEISAHLQENFGYPFRFHFVYVDDIPREPGGKFQIFKSELA